MSKEIFRRSDEGHELEFFINGVKHVVSDKLPPSTTLNQYLRTVAGLPGTKAMCQEGGCGCCAVTVTYCSDWGVAETMSINSCLCPLYSVDGWQICTVEGLGSQEKGLHPIQERLAKSGGTQCGYCSPGFVMSMYGLLNQQPKATQQDIEDSLDGHICRCTGYRPILDAMKSFGSDAKTKEKLLDMEDLSKHLCPKSGEACKGKGDAASSKGGNGMLLRPLSIDLQGGVKWFRPLNLKELTKDMTYHHKAHPHIKLLYGNTAVGILKEEGPVEIFIDLHAVHELHSYEEKDNWVIFGAGTTFTQLKERLKRLQDKPGYHYCSGIVKHIKIIGSLLVRNAGSIGGNLMIKHAHHDFPSDLFTIMEAVGAKIDVLDTKSHKRTSKIALSEFLKLDMKHKVVVCVEIPKWKPSDYFRSFKVTPRWQNAKAHVNAAFKIPVVDRKIVSKPSIVVGGIDANTIHAEKTEEFLSGKMVNESVIQEALGLMLMELDPSEGPGLASPKYRKELATNLLYKTLLEVYKPSRYSVQSGMDSLDRPLSSGQFTFQKKPEEFPLREPLPDKTAGLQASGEAQFVNDMPTFQHELAAAFVISTIVTGCIRSIDTSEALKMPGVIRFIGAEHLPKQYVNNYFVQNTLFKGISEELFASREIFYEGQGIGMIVAETMALAEEGARKVKVTYEDMTQPIMTLEDAIENDSKHDSKYREAKKGDAEEVLKNCAHVVEGEVRMGTQYQFFLENHVALTVPTEDGIEVYSANQWPDYAQSVVSQVINKPQSYCNVFVPRVGGAFGGKSARASATAAAAAVCTELTKRPVRVNLNLSTSMKMTEKRFPILAKYRAGCNADGKMQAADVDVYLDSGIHPSPLVFEVLNSIDQGYYIPNWRVKLSYMKTNKPMSGGCRAPGAVPGVLISETIMEHMAKELDQNPILFKEPNLYQQGQSDLDGHEISTGTLREMWTKLTEVAEVATRMAEIEKFNKNNMWHKRGISMTAVKYPMDHVPGGLPTSVSVFAGDGSVTVNTSGVETGQGLHMKVAQAVARTLGVSLDWVKVRPVNNSFLTNTMPTLGSNSSERCVHSAIAACKKINEGLKPLKEKMKGSPISEILTAAVFSNIPLYAIVDPSTSTPGTKFQYFTYMAAVSETEVDVLTGEFQVRRVDVMADFGESLNPTIDLGQVEGAYVMGLGAYMMEDVFYDTNSGKFLNDGTGDYKPPTTKDIPMDWRIHFLPDSPNSKGILSSKATEDPPVGLATGVLFSVKAAIENARQELTSEKLFVKPCVPFTVERIQQAANVSLSHLCV